MKGGCCDDDPLVCVMTSPRFVSASPLRLCGGRVEGRGVLACAVSPVLRCPRHLHGVPCLRVVLLPLCCSRSSSVLCIVVFVVGGEVRWYVACGTVSCSALLFRPLCLLSQYCWFRVVFLWHGCVIVEWR